MNISGRLKVSFVTLGVALLFWFRGCGGDREHQPAETPVTQIDLLFGENKKWPCEGEPIIPYTPPKTAVPKAKAIFPEVHVRLDGRTLKVGEPLSVKAGQRIQVKLEVPRNPKLPMNATMSANGLGLACQAENEEGWMIIEDQYFGANASTKASKSEGTWTVPERKGRFSLVVLGDASGVNDRVIPIRLIEEFPLTIH